MIYLRECPQGTHLKVKLFICSISCVHQDFGTCDHLQSPIGFSSSHYKYWPLACRAPALDTSCSLLIKLKLFVSLFVSIIITSPSFRWRTTTTTGLVCFLHLFPLSWFADVWLLDAAVCGVQLRHTFRFNNFMSYLLNFKITKILTRVFHSNCPPQMTVSGHLRYPHLVTSCHRAGRRGVEGTGAEGRAEDRSRATGTSCTTPKNIRFMFRHFS